MKNCHRRFVFGDLYVDSDMAFLYHLQTYSILSINRCEYRTLSTLGCSSSYQIYLQSRESIHLLHRSCDSRKYTYFFPTYLLIPPKPESGLNRSLQNPNSSLHPFWLGGDAAMSSREDDLIRKRQWRINSDQMNVLRETLRRFEGTVSFFSLSHTVSFELIMSSPHLDR
jgi:hypothetical protein